MFGNPEKLFTLQQAAQYLKLSEEEILELVDEGEVPAYKIGGTFFRFRKEQLDAIKKNLPDIDEQYKQKISTHKVDIGVYEAKKEEIDTPQVISFQEKIKDFIYYNNFYILSVITTLILIYLIIRFD